MSLLINAEQLDAVLPQTQCGDCGYGGCLPYAKAMAQGDADINLCPPGGERVLHKLATLLHKEVTQYHITPKPLRVAVIQEELCIGCTKCIQACPVDAISGAAKLMHTVISYECTGCNLCVEPCPMDCIEMQEITTCFSESQLQQKENLARTRFNARQARLAHEKSIDSAKHQQAKLMHEAHTNKQAAIAAAVARAKAKRTHNAPPKTP